MISINSFAELVELVSQGELEQAIHLCHQNFPGVIVDVFHPDFVKTHQMNHAQKKSPFRSDTPATSSKLSLSPGGATDPLAMAFQLHCQHFIELVRKDLQPEALQYAQTVLSKFGLVDTKFLEILRVHCLHLIFLFAFLWINDNHLLN